MPFPQPLQGIMVSAAFRGEKQVNINVDAFILNLDQVLARFSLGKGLLFAGTHV